MVYEDAAVSGSEEEEETESESASDSFDEQSWCACRCAQRSRKPPLLRVRVAEHASNTERCGRGSAS